MQLQRDLRDHPALAGCDKQYPPHDRGKVRQAPLPRLHDPHETLRDIEALARRLKAAAHGGLLSDDGCLTVLMAAEAAKLRLENAAAALRII